MIFITRILYWFTVLPALSQAQSLLPFVDLHIGTTGGGNSFPGSSRPFGAVKVGPDTISTSSATAGWTSGGKLTGISMLHESGTGGTPKYGVISQMPYIGSLSLINVGDNRTYAQTRVSETPAVVHYSTLLASNVSINVTSARHSATLKYRFTQNGEEAHVIVDVAHHLPTLSGELQFPETYLGGEITALPNGTYFGNGSYAGSWNRSPKWTVYFCASFNPPPTTVSTFSYPYDFNKPPSTSPPLSTNTSYQSSTPSSSSSTLNVPGAVFSWPANTTTIESRLGVSWISPSKACSFSEDEIPWSKTFEEIVKEGEDEWEKDVFEAITVPEGNTDASSTNSTLLTMLYSSLYYAGLLPSDRTGENPNPAYPEGVPYYDDFYTIWDTFRSWTPLQHLIQTDRYVGIIRSLIETWKTDGFLPDGRSSNFNGREQGGTNADVVLADAFVKGLSGNPDINWSDGWNALWTDGNVIPPNPNPDPDSPKDSTAEGRGALDDWVKYGWITPNHTRSVSRAVEYSLNDFGLYQVAKGLGNVTEAEKYLNRSDNWQNMWNLNLTAGGFRGFLAPRRADGSWDVSNYDVIGCATGCYWGNAVYEASPWEYSFSMPHDIAKVIELSGGPDAFVARLDATFANHYNDVGNEPSFLTPMLYNWVNGKQYKSVKAVRDIVNGRFGITSSGLPGNGDAGAMQSYLIWLLLGLYPITGTTTYALTSPFFSAIDVQLRASATGVALSEANRLKIRATGLNVSSFYVQHVSLDGVRLDRSWLKHEEIVNGGLLEFALGPEPVGWDTGELPPSVSTKGFVN